MNTINEEIKKKIVAGLNELRKNFAGSDNKFAVSVGINAAIWSQVKKGKTDKVLSDANWISLARRAGVSLTDEALSNAVSTPLFQFITAQLELCQKKSVSGLLSDDSDIGKTYIARHYAKTHKNVVYADCSQVKAKQRLIRFIAKSFGVGSTGRYYDVYENLVFYIKTLPAPLIVLDEAGDLQYDAFLELKALWNRTEHACGFYMMGADGLKEKIQRYIDCKKVGYTEMFTRFGGRYNSVFTKLNRAEKIIPMSSEEKLSVLIKTAMMIIKANIKSGDANIVLKKSLREDGTPSLRRIYIELMKQD